VSESRFSPEYFSRRYIDAKFGVSAERRRSYLYRAIARLARRACPDARVILEVGCGVGYLSKQVASMPTRPVVLATDLAREALRFAKRNTAGQARVFPCLADAHSLPTRTEWADIVLAFDVMEHLSEPDLFLRDAARSLRPGGVLLISTPNPGSLGARLKGRYPEWRGRPIEEREQQWFGYRDDTHVSIRSIPSWRSSLSAAGFAIERDGTDFWWDTPYVSWAPALLQKVAMGGLHRLITVAAGFLPWLQGENYLAICRRVAIREPAA
jgi:SAM-dependent methyltransferase